MASPQLASASRRASAALAASSSDRIGAPLPFGLGESLADQPLPGFNKVNTMEKEAEVIVSSDKVSDVCTAMHVYVQQHC